MELAIGISGLVLGGGGFFTFAIVAYRAGEWTAKLRAIEKALNGDGPWQRKFDSTARHLDENRKAIQEVQRAFLKRDRRCVEHADEIGTLKEKVAIVERRQERKSAGE